MGKYKRLEKRVAELEKQLEHDTITTEEKLWYSRYSNEYTKATLKGKIDAIIEHLKIEIDVKEKECTPAEVTVSKKDTKYSIRDGILSFGPPKSLPPPKRKYKKRKRTYMTAKKRKNRSLAAKRAWKTRRKNESRFDS